MKHALKVFCAIMAFMFCLTSCSDDLGVKIDNPDGFTGITVLIPDVSYEAVTRASDDAYTDGDKIVEETVAEGTISRLDMVAIDSEGKLHFFNDMKPLGTQGSYSAYRLALASGEYKLYVFGNVNYYLDGAGLNNPKNIEDVIENNETGLRGLKLNYKSDEPLAPGKLPMVCLGKNIQVNNNKVGSDSSGNANSFTVRDSENIFIYADMEFLCSKVRYTILFNSAEGGFSDYGKNVIDFNRNEAYAEKLRSQTALEYNGNADRTFLSNSWHVNMGRYYFPAKGDKYPESATDALQSFNLTDANWENDYTQQRAWQGVVYLPENEESIKTVIKLPYTINKEPEDNPKEIVLFNDGTTNKDEHKFSGIIRGKMYDIRAKLVNPDFISTDMEVEDWNLKTLSYNLHGPYILEVEHTSMDVVYSGKWTPLRFYANVPDEEIDFEYPVLTYEGVEYPFYTAEVITRETTDEGNLYDFGEWQSTMRIQVNPEIPYSVLKQLENGGSYNGLKEEDLRYFHIIAGNIHKKIDIDLLTLEPFLTVTPKVIIIDTREEYVSTPGFRDIPISFKTNYDITLASVDFNLIDESYLLNGLGEGDLKLESDCVDRWGLISEKEGIINLQVRNIFEGHDFWNHEHEYKITFYLSDPELDITLSEEVVILVKPFTTNYIIHFKNNSQDWESPHIFIYQDLTLPSDLTKYKPGSDEYKNEGDTHEPHPYADRIVGYIENNSSLNLQWNAATQYVFSNNIAFLGWTGYGGPDDNDPWADGQCNSNVADNLDNKYRSTMGFFMFGEPAWDNSWNFEYSYQKENSANRYKHYRYDVNFNQDHEKSYDSWHCQDCKDLKQYYGNEFGGDYNYLVGDDYTPRDKDGRGYPGIAMEYEGDGWWRYTLTGVAQPGKTMLFFANWHEPWNAEKAYGNYIIEDNRYPGDYEAGLELFDYEKNEGWFLFDGNGTNTDQHFKDYKPDSRPIHFTPEMCSAMRIEIMKPSSDKQITKIEIKDKVKVTHEWGDNYKYEYHDYKTLQIDQLKDAGDRYYIEPQIAALKDEGYFTVRLYFNNSNDNYMDYELAPKNFIWNDSKDVYVTLDPLRFEFVENMKMLIKWSDNISMNGWNFQPYEGGCEYMNVYWGENTSGTQVGYGRCEATSEIGNYKHVEITTNTPPSSGDKSKLYLALGTGAWNNVGGNYGNTLKIEDMPKFYNPDNEMYIVNWQILRPGHY